MSTYHFKKVPLAQYFYPGLTFFLPKQDKMNLPDFSRPYTCIFQDGKRGWIDETSSDLYFLSVTNFSKLEVFVPEKETDSKEYLSPLTKEYPRVAAAFSPGKEFYLCRDIPESVENKKTWTYCYLLTSPYAPPEKVIISQSRRTINFLSDPGLENLYCIPAYPTTSGE